MAMRGFQNFWQKYIQSIIANVALLDLDLKKKMIDRDAYSQHVLTFSFKLRYDLLLLWCGLSSQSHTIWTDYK